jgi:hypothetical protein
MQHKFFLIFAIAVIGTSNINAQTAYTSNKDEKYPDVTILKGIISKYILVNDTSFTKWYTSNQNAYKPSETVLSAMEGAKDK